MKSPGACLREVKWNLPRVLALFDVDRTSSTYGMGDRFRWAWGLIDFGNGTFQGAASGMSRLWRYGLWPYRTEKDRFLERIDSLFGATATLTRKDGSLEEAFPNEGSFCVTALVAFDLLCAVDLLHEEAGERQKQHWLSTVDPLIGYLKREDETHAVISNHLATAVAAMVRWHQCLNDPAAETRARVLLERILSHQSSEGWFLEYQGADPGYQSLCTYYLADIHERRPDWQLLEPLRRSCRFLWNFAHPDGSFGGIYGSRSTRFYVPAGILALGKEIHEAACLASFMQESIATQKVVTLSSMDEPNLVPMFNAYCWAAVLEQECEKAAESGEDANILPALRDKGRREYFPGAGLLVDSGAEHYTIVATHKGGVTYHFVGKRLVRLDAGLVVRSPTGRLGSTQVFDQQNEAHLSDKEIRLKVGVSAMPKRLPGPFQFLVLRLLCGTIFRFSRVREWVKKTMVYMLITRDREWPASNVRTIALGRRLHILDEPILKEGYTVLNTRRPFVSIHMASQGYWQQQDEELMEGER